MTQAPRTSPHSASGQTVQRLARLGAVWLASLGAMAQAQDVALTGLTADKALLVIDGATPRFVSAGQSVQGVKVLSVGPDQAVVEVHGQRRTLQMGQSPMPLGGTGNAGGTNERSITLVADAQGHFQSEGQINGKSTRFLLDTGATVLTVSETEAKRLGLPYQQGQRARIRTANGDITGYQLSLNTVRLGSYTGYNVAAVVLPADMPFVLLGNSFLARFNMRRENDRMTLEPRY